MKYLLYSILILLLTCCKPVRNEWVVVSPDQKVKASVFFQDEGNNDSGSLFYTIEVLINKQYETVINPSPLGLISNRENLAERLSFLQESGIKRIDEEYEMISGKQRICHNLANEITLTFTNPDQARIVVQFRAYNDGVAFRYILPGEGQRTIELEETGFSIPGEGLAWIAPYDTAAPWSPGYETLYTNGTDAGEDAPGRAGWAFPALFKVNGTWLLVSEAGLCENYCGSHLEPEVENGTYKIRFPEADERYGKGERLPSWRLPWEMPWRFIIVGNDLNTIIKSNMPCHLSEPCRIPDTDWIIPGRSSWSWWSSTTHGRKMDTLKQYADLSAEMGWEYTLVDAGWENMLGGTAEEFIAYANNLNVGTWLWYNSGGRQGTNFTRNAYVMEDSTLRKNEMKRIRELGVKGIKVDFFCSDKQDVIKLYLDILKDAAENRLLVNFHGCTLPRGWRRTYPNLLSMEAIMGGENYRYNEHYTEDAPWHNTIAFFTRNTVGPMDYTPVMFSNNRYPHKTTYGHELATCVLFESGIVHFADKAESYRAADPEVKAFLSAVPVTWEETILLDGYPGKYAVVARKSADNAWYVAGINGEDEEMQIKINRDFLAQGKNYSLKMITDLDPVSFHTENLTHTNEDMPGVTMLPFGGFVMIIE